MGCKSYLAKMINYVKVTINMIESTEPFHKELVSSWSKFYK